MDTSHPENTLAITALDIQTPLGDSTQESAAAIRAGIHAAADYSDYTPIESSDSGSDGTPLSASFEDGIANYGWQRLLWLVEQPIVRSFANLGLDRSEYKNASMRFALPYADPVIQELTLPDKFPALFHRHFGLPELQQRGAVTAGNSGFMQQLQSACLDIQQGRNNLVVIVAIDSYLLEKRLDYYDENWRLKSARNAGGFIPGEAAAVCCVESIEHARNRGAAPLLTIGGLGFGQETNAIEGAKSSTGTGHSQAINTACAALDPNSVGWVFSDLNGEAYRGYEWGIIRSRCHTLFKNEISHVHPADTIGEVGAAAAAVHLACISQAFARNYAREDLAIVLSSNDSGQRAAMSVNRPLSGRG